MYDIAIIGLGPAGSTLARLLSHNFKTVAIDRKNLDGAPGGYQKPCGGLLSPGAQKALVKSGLNLPVSLLADPQIFAAKTMDLASGLTRHYQCGLINIDRHKFDLWLASLIPAGVEIIDRARCRQIVDKCSHYNITFDQNGRQYTIAARYVVGADGSASIVRRTLAPTPINRYICLQESYASQSDDFFGCFFDPQITDCYGWINNKNGRRILGAALPLSKPRARLEMVKEKLRLFGYNFKPSAGLEAALASRPSGLKQINPGRQNMFLIGEAAGLISPSSLSGISYAVESANQLSRVLNRDPADPLKDYSRSLNPLRLRISIRMGKSFFIYQPYLRHLGMLSRVSSLDMNRT